MTRLFFLFLFIGTCYACKIELKIKSGTKRPFQVEVMIPSIAKHTERLEIDKINVVKRTVVEGPNCGSKHWTIRTFAKKASGNFEKIHDRSATFDGDGELTVLVLDDLIPRIDSRNGVACSETLICG